MENKKFSRLIIFIICMACSILFTAGIQAQQNYLEGTFHGFIRTSMLKDNAKLTPDGNIHIEIDDNKTISFINSKYDVTIVQKTKGKVLSVEAKNDRNLVPVRAADFTLDGNMDVRSYTKPTIQVSGNITIKSNSKLVLNSPDNCLRSDKGDIIIYGDVTANSTYGCAVWAYNDIQIKGRLKAVLKFKREDSIYAKKGDITLSKTGFLDAEGKRGVVTGSGAMFLYGEAYIYGHDDIAVRCNNNFNSGSNSKLYINSDSDYALYAREDIRLLGGNFTAIGYGGGIYSKNGIFLVSGAGTYKITSKNGIGIRSKKDMTFKAGKLRIEGKSKAVYSKSGTIKFKNNVSILTPKNGKVKSSTIIYSSSGNPASVVNIGVQPAPTPTEAPYKVGTILKDKSGNKYKVTNSNLKTLTVSFVSPYNGVSGKVKIVDYVTSKGRKYNLTAIESNAFEDRKNITSVTLGSNVKSIGGGAFKGCTSLKTVTTGNALASIGTNAFCSCVKLTKFTIPSKVYYIGNGAFKGCSSISSLVIETRLLKENRIGMRAFSGTPANIIIKVPSGMKKTYKELLCSKGINPNASFSE